MWYLCPQSLLADGSSMATCKKWIQGPHIHSPLSGHVSLCLNHRCPNLLSRSSCSPNESLAAGPLYKTDKQKGSLAEVREERRVPILLGLPVPSVAPQAPAEISSFCPAILVPFLVTDSHFPLWPHPHPFSDRDSMHQPCQSASATLCLQWLIWERHVTWVGPGSSAGTLPRSIKQEVCSLSWGCLAGWAEGRICGPPQERAFLI